MDGLIDSVMIQDIWPNAKAAIYAFQLHRVDLIGNCV